MKFRNISTNEVVNICGIKRNELGIIVSGEPGGRDEGKKFCEKWAHVITECRDADGKQYFEVTDGWELMAGRAVAKVKKSDEPAPAKVRKARAPKAPQQEPQAEPAQAQQADEPMKLDDPTKVWADIERGDVQQVDDVVDGYVTDLQAGVTIDACRKELLAKYGSMGEDILNAAIKIAESTRPASASVNAEQVRSICEEYCANIKPQTRVIEIKQPNGTVTTISNGSLPDDFQYYVNIVNARKPLYMYGPAGCGKSYMAKKIAEALGLPYYETSQAMFAHELKGYGDAAGRYVETAFYKAFTEGAVFFLDEVDASAPEALVVLNNAIANRRFDFPVVGNVEAHENFRVIAAGNTRMTGATLSYVARQMQDTSFKNRFFFELVGYNREVFLNICGGDEEIVNFGEDLRRAARETKIQQLFSYRQGEDLATLQACCKDDAHLLRGSVLQEKEVDDTENLYAHLRDKNNRWAQAMRKCIDIMKTEEVW